MPFPTGRAEALVLMDAQGTILDANPDCCAVLRASRDQLVGRSATEFIDPGDVGTRPLRTQEVLAGEPARGRRTLRRSDGTTLRADTFTALLGGNVVVAFSEVPREEDGQEAVERREARHRKLLERGWDVILLVDAPGRVEWSSPGVSRVLGYEPDAFLGRIGMELIHADDLGSLRAVFTRLALQPGGAAAVEARARHQDGRWVWLEFRGRNLLFDPDVRAIAVTYRDVTARKEIEEVRAAEQGLLTAVMDNVPGFVFALDGDGRFVRWNARMEAFAGQVGEALEGAPVLNLVAPEERVAVAGGLRDALAGKVTQVEMEIGRRTGTPLPYLFTVARFRLNDEPHVLGIGIDVSERRRLEQQLWQAQKLEAVGRLAGGLAHDFNNMMTAVMGNVELLSDALPEGDGLAAHVLEQIGSVVERSTHLTRQLLSFSRRAVSEVKVLRPDTVLVELDGILRRLLGADVELVTLLPDDPWNVRMDPGQLDQVLTNLAINGRDAMPRGGRLTIALDNVSLDRGAGEMGPGDYVRFRVTDNGVGMSQETMGRIFEPFFSTKPANQGTGLGLAVCYGIVRGAQGHIQAESGEGKGSTFFVYIPRCTGPAPVEAPPPLSPGMERGSETVLVVEDEEQIGALIGGTLVSRGYSVTVTRSAEEGLDVLSRMERPPDLVVSDVMLPQMSGTDMVRRIRERHGDMPVVLVSGYTQASVGRDMFPGAAPVNFLAKPFRPADLAALIRRTLDSGE